MRIIKFTKLLAKDLSNKMADILIILFLATIGISFSILLKISTIFALIVTILFTGLVLAMIVSSIIKFVKYIIKTWKKSNK